MRLAAGGTTKNPFLAMRVEPLPTLFALTNPLQQTALREIDNSSDNAFRIPRPSPPKGRPSLLGGDLGVLMIPPQSSIQTSDRVRSDIARIWTERSHTHLQLTKLFIVQFYRKKRGQHGHWVTNSGGAQISHY
jgi:hypothetical protein